jgi:peptide/nickel transport system substrate-binding protein
MTKAVRIARTVDVTTLNPLLYNDRGTGEVLNRMYSHLVVTNSAGGYAYGSIVEDAGEERYGDRVEYTLRLRTDARWHDGAPVTSADVEYTVSRVLDPDLDSPRRPELLSMGADLRVRTDGPHTVRIAFTPTGSAGLQALAWLPILPRHAPDSTVPLGSGEFRFRTWDPVEGTVTLDAHRGHWAPSTVDGAFWRRFPDSVHALESVLRGRSDIAASVPPSLARSAAGDSAVRVHTSSDGSCTYLGYNTGSGVLRDRDVRVALATAIDRRRLVDVVLAGQGIPAATLIHPRSSWYCADAVGYRFDPYAAGELLDRLGWRRGAGGIRHDAQGRPLSLSLRTVAADDVKQETATELARQLGDVGVEVRVEPLPMSTLLAQYVYPRRYELVLLALNPGPSPSFFRAFYHSGAETGGPGNRFGYTNPTVDKLIDTLPPLDRVESALAGVQDIQRQVAVDAPHTPLFHPDVVDVASAALLLPRIDGIGTNRFSDLHRWDFAGFDTAR